MAPDGATPTRERILYASAELFRRQGYAATGLKQVSAEARAPFGSLYHFFPQGKEQLADQVLRAGGRFFLALYEAIAGQSADFPGAIEDFFAGAADTLVRTDFADACPVATVAGEVASTHEHLRLAAADAFELWLTAIESDAIESGIKAPRARELALSILAVLEGAFLLSRSLRSIEPMHAAGHAARSLVSDALACSNHSKGRPR